MDNADCEHHMEHLRKPDCDWWDIEIDHCRKCGHAIATATFENPQASRSSQVIMAVLPDGTDVVAISSRDIVRLIAAAERVAIGGTYFGHAPRWGENHLAAHLLRDCLR